ncbi:MAG TPA: CpaD family pilus assembly lipoprotein [Sphingomicrobium sp.]|nr:CpaD family pilus assembly lipoprotein [Sphingomicrobium sp.]
MMVRKTIAILLVSAAAACTAPGQDTSARGLSSVHEPVLNRSVFALDVAAPGGIIPPAELARVDGWFRSLGVGYGDSIFVDGPYAETARAQVAELAGNYGMMVRAAAPVTAGMVAPDMVRVVVSRTRVDVAGCPDWSVPSQPNVLNNSMSNFGCALNSNLAAMVADPEDLVHGREGTGVGDAATATKAVTFYRTTPPTGAEGLQDISTKKDKE